MNFFYTRSKNLSVFFLWKIFKHTLKNVHVRGMVKSIEIVHFYKQNNMLSVEGDLGGPFGHSRRFA